MKKLNLLYLFIIPVIIFSCSTFEKFDHFGVGNTFEESFTVDVPVNGTLSFNGSAEFSAADDTTIEDNLENIQAFDVTQIMLKITDYKGNPEAVANGSFNVTTITANGVTPVGDPVAISDLNFAQAFASDNAMELDLTQATFEAIADAYLSNQKLTVEASGDITGATEDLQIEFTVYMSIEATINNN